MAGPASVGGPPISGFGVAGSGSGAGRGSLAARDSSWVANTAASDSAAMLGAAAWVRMGCSGPRAPWPGNVAPTRAASVPMGVSRTNGT